jgi:hypothetical protein
MRDKNKIIITVPMDKPRHAELSTIARSRGLSLAAFMREAAYEKVRKDREAD